ncbi:translation initiation factor IF-2-like [Meles meles]|uniref:translation initiation factor IF-2-like n=1 Tax=Meles meles TaxID=9662 RepID=UPI001E69D34B|nr:translation initiation factor IF-2-like [Meles meles]
MEARYPCSLPAPQHPGAGWQVGRPQTTRCRPACGLRPGALAFPGETPGPCPETWQNKGRWDRHQRRTKCVLCRTLDLALLLLKGGALSVTRSERPPCREGQELRAGVLAPGGQLRAHGTVRAHLVAGAGQGPLQLRVGGRHSRPAPGGERLTGPELPEPILAAERPLEAPEPGGTPPRVWAAQRPGGAPAWRPTPAPSRARSPQSPPAGVRVAQDAAPGPQQEERAESRPQPALRGKGSGAAEDAEPRPAAGVPGSLLRRADPASSLRRAPPPAWSPGNEDRALSAQPPQPPHPPRGAQSPSGPRSEVGAERLTPAADRLTWGLGRPRPQSRRARSQHRQGRDRRRSKAGSFSGSLRTPPPLVRSPWLAVGFPEHPDSGARPRGAAAGAGEASRRWKAPAAGLGRGRGFRSCPWSIACECEAGGGQASETCRREEPVCATRTTVTPRSTPAFLPAHPGCLPAAGGSRAHAPPPASFQACSDRTSRGGHPRARLRLRPGLQARSSTNGSLSPTVPGGGGGATAKPAASTAFHRPLVTERGSPNLRLCVLQTARQLLTRRRGRDGPARLPTTPSSGLRPGGDSNRLQASSNSSRPNSCTT